MLNKIWCFFIVISIIFGFINGTYIKVNEALFIGIENTITLIISFIGTISFWTGIMNIVQNTSLIDKIKKILKPLIKLIFPNIDLNSEVGENIAMNMASNVLGLGNAATPCGLRTIEKLQEKNVYKEYLSNEMLIFILINTASIQLIPTTIISIRSGMNSNNPTSIVPGVWFSSCIAFISMLIIAKFYVKVRGKCK